RGRTRGSYVWDEGDDGDGDDDDGSDYIVGRGHSVSSHSHSVGRRRRVSDDASYGGILDDESRGGGGDGVWSINRSVFSTLPNRRGRSRGDRGSTDGSGGSLYDDDEDSIFSGASSHSRRGAMGHSSSVASRLSQSSQQSSSQRSQQSGSSNHSFRFSRRNRIGNDGASCHEYDSDDSIASLAGGFDVGRGDFPSFIGGDASFSDASSASFLFDRKNVTDDNDRSKEQCVADFEDTLSHLESLGFRVQSDGEGSVGSEESSVASKDAEGGTDEDAAWWIRELELEGWFDHDTSMVHSDKVTPSRPELGGSGEEDTHLNDELADSKHSLNDAENQVVPTPSPLDDSDTSTVGAEEDDEVEDWEERLWSLARSHYLEYSGARADVDGDSVSQFSLLEKANLSVTELDEQSVKDKEELYNVEYATEQRGVFEFRSLLLQCVETYVDAFYRRDYGHHESGSQGDTNLEAGSEIEWSDHPIDLKVYPYIPLPTARALFLEVIRSVDRGGSSRLRESITTSEEKRADVVTSILTDDVLNIFRRYQVITPKTQTKISGNDSTRGRQRLPKKGGGAKSSGDARTELENYLYGEMHDIDHRQEGQKNATPDVTETREHEIRIRSDIARYVLKRANTKHHEESLDFICGVLLSNIRSVTGANIEGHNQEDDQHSSSAYVQSNLPTQFLEDQPMASLYCLRYTPTFILKALTLQQLGGEASMSSRQKKATQKSLSDLLFDESYLIKRLELQGPYNATMAHLADWQKAFFFENNVEKHERDDNKEYEAVHTAIVSALCAHLETTLQNTGYHEGKAEEAENEESTGNAGPENDDGGISTRNYAIIVATCLEIGRALHHLGVCLGRRQRDNAKGKRLPQDGEEGSPKERVVGDIEAAGSIVSPANVVALEVTSYKNALEAYKAAIYVLSKAESCAISDGTVHSKELNGQKRDQNMLDGELQQQREAFNTRRDTSQVRDMPDDVLQEIRDAKISVELHLADTLNCLGYCHDAKLSEYDKSLMAYRESLSLYIKHVGRFHKMVSIALHNLGAIHVELGQWKEATSCFRQCLVILKRRAEKDHAGQHEQSQMFVTLQCLGNSLAELGEYDASIACFQEIINAAGNDESLEETKTGFPSAFSGELLSQIAHVHINQAFKLSRTFHWQCHSLLFANSEGRGDEDPGSILARQLHVEQNGITCIKRSIHSKRCLCYSPLRKESKPDGGFFSSLDKNGESTSQFPADDEDLASNVSSRTAVYHVSAEAPPLQLSALTKDLLAAARLEFRSRSYKAALSYCWESLLLKSKNSSEINDMLVFDGGFLKSESSLYRVPDNALSALDLIDVPLSTHDAGVEFLQLLFLMGVTYTRMNDLVKAKAVLQKARAVLEPARPQAETKAGANGTLEDALLQTDVAHICLRIGFVESKLGNSELAASNFKEAIRVFNSTATHPIFSGESQVDATGVVAKGEDVDIGKRNVSLNKRQLKVFEMILKNGLASALHRLGQTYADKARSDKAMKCFEDTAHILNQVHEARAKLDWKRAPTLPLPSRCFWEEIDAVSTSLILSDANERSGRLSMEGRSHRFSLQCFERAIGMREFITSTVMDPASALDTESSLELGSGLDDKNMDCYSAMLMLIEKREMSRRRKSKEGEEKSWKIYNKFGIDADMDSEQAAPTDDSDESLLTKEDILFRVGNLFVKSGRLRDAINSYKEAEELTVARLGTKDHAIVQNILHNMGNAYRTMSLYSRSRQSRSAKENALECYSESIRISQVFMGRNHVTAAESMQNLALLHMRAGNAWLDVLNNGGDDEDDELAYKSFKESLSIRRRETGSQNELEMASILHHLGQLCVRKIGYYHRRCEDAEALKLVDDALAFLSESLKIRKLSLAHDHPQVGDSYQSLGIAHLNRAIALTSNDTDKESECARAQKALTSALEIHRSYRSSLLAKYGTNSSDEYHDRVLMEALCLFYLGRVGQVCSKFGLARSHLVDALKLFQAEGKKMLSIMSRAGEESPGNADSEGKLLMELEAINHWAARALYHLASIHKARGCSEDAVSCFQEALRIRAQCINTNTKKHRLDSALIHLDLAKGLHDNENYDKAIECFSFSLRTYLARFGKDSLPVANTLTSMGKSFVMKSLFEKAMQCYDKAIRVYDYREGLALKERKGLLHREIAVTVQRLNGDLVEALEHYRSSVSFLEEFNERQRVVAGVVNGSPDQAMNKRLLLYYSEMLTILRQVVAVERDHDIKGEMRDEIGDVLHRMGNLHATFGQYDSAMTCFSEVLETLRKANNDELRIADLLFNMGNIHLEQGRPEKSLDCLYESYGITKEALGEGNAELHSTLYLMGVAMTNLLDYENALKWLTRALSVLMSDEDFVDDAARGKTLQQLGTVCEKTGDQAKAISYLEESVEILKGVQGIDLHLSNALNSLGNLLRNVSQFEQALDCYGQSLTIRIGIGDELLIANTKNNIGAALLALALLDRAMAFSAISLRIKTERLGYDSVETARALVNMGQIYLDQKRHNDAKKYFDRGLKIFQANMEKDHPDIAMCIHKLGVIREALFDDEGALEYYHQSVDIFKSNSASKQSATLAYSLHNAALIYFRQTSFERALECMMEALDTKISVFGAMHPETAASHHWLGTIHLELDHSEAALCHFKDALKSRVENFGTEHIDVAGTLSGLGQVHFIRGEFDESIECLVENLRVLRKFGREDEEVSRSELLIGSAFQEMAQFDLANEHLSEALHTMISAHGENHLDVAQALFRLGICHCETENHSESLTKFEECLEIRTALLGNLHIECANTYESIGIVQQKTNCHGDAIHSFERALAIKKTSLPEDHEDFCVLLHFIGSSLFALKRYDEAVGYFRDSTDRKNVHYGRTDEEYAMSVIDLAAAYAKTDDENSSMECYREAIESGGLASDSWELGVANKCLAGYFFNQNMCSASLERYNEAASIFEWNMDNVQGCETKLGDIIQCYEHLLDLEDDNTGPISEARADLCYKLANSYVQVNKHEDAVLMYREAIMIQTQLHGTDNLSVANSLHNLGNCYRDLCNFEKSAECLTKSLSLSSINYQDENEEVADTAHCLGLTLMSTCELDEAASFFERALSIRKKKLGALDLNIASTLFNIASVALMRGNWSNAMKNCKEALKIQRMTVGDDSPITANTLECIGRIHMDKREFENALQCFSKCISSNGKSNLQRECGIIYHLRGERARARKMQLKAGLHVAQQLGLSSESDSLDLVQLAAKFHDQKQRTADKDLLGFAQNVMFYGSVLMNLDNFSEALDCFRTSNVIFQAKYGSDHLTLAENLHRTGFVLEKMSESKSQLDEALELLLEALRIRRLHLVGCHPDLEETLLCLGRAHHKLGNIGDALDFLTKAVKAKETRLGRNHARMDDADALLQVGQLHQQSGQFRQALDSFEECLEIRRQILGGDHPSIGELLFYIGNLLREVGDLDLAQMKFKEALSIAEQEPDSLETADILFSLGVLHTEQKQFSLALDAYLGSLQIHKGRGSANVATAEILNNIGITYSGMKDFDRAQVYHSEALEMLRQELGDDHGDVAFCWHSLGVVQQELGDQMEALHCYQNAVGIERTELSLQSLGILLAEMNDNENAYVCLEEALRMKSLDCETDADDDYAEIQRYLGIIWIRKKHFDEGLKCFEEALKVKMPHFGESEKDDMNVMNCLDGALDAVSELYGTHHMKYARLMHTKGNFHGAKNEHSLAIEAYVEVLRIYKAAHGDTHLSVANTLFNLGVSLNAKGSPDKAIRCFTKALRITKARLGEDHLDVADTYEQVAESNKLLCAYDEATNYYEKALYVRKQAMGGSDLKSAAIMHALGKLHSQEGRWEKAERAFKEAVRIRTVHLEDDPLVAESMFDLGLVYKSRGDNIKALKYLEGSLRIRKSKLAGSDSQLADNYRLLGSVHGSLGSVDKSIFCYDMSMQIYAETCEQSENIALSLAGKGETLQEDDRFYEALACFSESLDIRKSIDGPTSSKESGDALTRMGEIYSKLGDGTNASSSFASALSTYRQAFGTRHQTVADLLQVMSSHFVKVGEFERAFSCVKEALDIRQGLLGSEDTKTGDSHYCMGTILFAWNDYAKAIASFEKARDIHKQKLGESHLSVANSNFYLGCISERKREYKSATAYLQDSLSGRREHLNEMDPEIAENLTRLGHVYFKLSDYDQAVTAFSDCLKIREAIRGTDAVSQIHVADALFDLGTALQKALDTTRSMQLFRDGLRVYERHLESPHDVKIARCHSCIGEIYEKTNELAKAVGALEVAIGIYEHHIGADPSEKQIRSSKNIDAYSGQAETLFRLATAKDRMGEEVTALKQYRKAMRLYKSLFGRDNLHVAKILNRLANMKGRAGSVDKAMVLFDESLRIRMLHLGNNHEDVAETLFGMGIVFEKRRDYGAAMKAYSDCLRIRSSKFGSDSMEVAQVVVNIGVVRGNKSDFSGALKSWNKALSIYRKHGLENDDALVATVLSHQRLANQLRRRSRKN
ncbi:hypothetical protein ACHAWF_018004, partial [Thalassiosira exigua]